MVFKDLVEIAAKPVKGEPSGFFYITQVNQNTLSVFWWPPTSDSDVF